MYDAIELEQLRTAFRTARSSAKDAQEVVTAAYKRFLREEGAGPTAVELAHLHASLVAEGVACQRYVGKLETLSTPFTSR